MKIKILEKYVYSSIIFWLEYTSKFAQTFAVRFLKSSSIHPICINAWEASPLTAQWDLNGKKKKFKSFPR